MWLCSRQASNTVSTWYQAKNWPLTWSKPLKSSARSSLTLFLCVRVRARGRARPAPSHTILWSLLCHARLPATPWLPQALSCDPIHFYPGHSALLPSVLPTPLGLPLLLPLLYLSFVYLLMCEIILGWRDGFLPDGLSRGVSLLFNNRFGGLGVGGECACVSVHCNRL